MMVLIGHCIAMTMVKLVYHGLITPLLYLLLLCLDLDGQIKEDKDT